MVNRPGVIAKTYRREGDMVKAGDTLAIVDVDVREESGLAVAGQGVQLLDRQADITRSQAAAARQMTLATRQQLDARIASARTQLGNLKQQISIQEQVVALNHETLGRIRPAVEKGFVSTIEFERRRQAALQSEQQLQVLRQQVNSLNAESVQAGLERRSTESQLIKELATIDSSLTSVERERLSVSSARSIKVTSPIDGRVTAVQLAAGQSVQPAIAIMTIVPNHTQLEAELYAPSRSIGFVRPGQSVSLLVDAFPYQKFGAVGAKVATVSATMIEAREAFTPFKLEEPVFKVRVQLSDDPGRTRLALQPGMTLTANIILERRSFIDWILSPLSAITKRTD
jgi:membrane fusion protein